MKFRDQELLARLRALGSKARHAHAGPAEVGAGVAADAVSLLGLPEHELTPSVRAALHELIEEMIDLRTEIVDMRSRLTEMERLADEDALAPISNRRAFLRHLERTIGYIQRYQATSSLLYFDLNGLKSINDGHGHAAGDAALVHVANLLLSHTRNSDLVGRLGGDEFGVILARADETAAQAKAASLADAVTRNPLTFEGRTIAISVAFGAHGLAPGEDPGRALALADHAMYQQKRASGRTA
jgi:diguanylate cyclase (GGDEF)-like protein